MTTTPISIAVAMRVRARQRMLEIKACQCGGDLEIVTQWMGPDPLDHYFLDEIRCVNRRWYNFWKHLSEFVS